MKRFILITIGFFLIIGVAPFIRVGVASATISGTDEKKCYKIYNGASDTASTPADAKKLTQKLLSKFKGDKLCRHKYGGSCVLNKSSQGQTISCDNPDASLSASAAPPSQGGDTPSDCATATDCQGDPALTAGVCDSTSCDIITNYVNPFIRLLSVLVGVAIVIGIIFGGIQVTTSAGDPQKSASGKKHIQNALIALVAYVVLFGFLQWLIPGGIV